MTLLVRDEVETIRATLDYHQAAGVEHFIVTDNGSIDGTAEYLRSLEHRGLITLIEEPEHTHSQGKWVTRMARRAASNFDVDWIIHCDADEYFWTDSGDLRDFFAAISPEVDVLRVHRVNMLKDPECNHGHYLLHNVICDVASGQKLGPKVAHRPHKDASITEGNHHVAGLAGGVLQRPDGLIVYHYPFRSYATYEQKIIKGAEALQRNADLPEVIGAHWRNAYKRLETGDLRRDFERNMPTTSAKQEGLKSGRFKMVDDVAAFAEQKGVASKSIPIVKPTNPQDGFCYLDIGARGGAVLPDVGMPITKIMVEPEQAEFQKLSGANERDFIVGIALGDTDGDITFHEAKNPYCSSVLKPNMAVLGAYRFAHHFEVKNSVVVNCARYETLHRDHDIPVPDAIKIDVQGYEHEVLRGFGDLLDDVLAIKMEQHFYPLYEGQKLLHENIDLLAEYGLVLRRLYNPRSPELNGDRHFQGDLVEVDAIFTKSRAWLGRNPDKKAKFDAACTLVGVEGYR